MSPKDQWLVISILIPYLDNNIPLQLHRVQVTMEMITHTVQLSNSPGEIYYIKNCQILVHIGPADYLVHRKYIVIITNKPINTP